MALVLPRSMELIAAELAVARAGAAFLPVDPAYPAERRALMLADAAPAVTLDDPRRVRELLDTGDGTAAAARVDADHAAYVIYTSGSTGTPQGRDGHPPRSRRLHQSRRRGNTRWAPAAACSSSPRRASTPPCWSCASPSRPGATLVVPPHGPWLGDELAAVLDEHRISHALIPAGRARHPARPPRRAPPAICAR
ncbi:AMP-binding protein [Streptomyces tricolor]|nr:AMP-binding protein [Streptomyces tricolor]